MRSLDLNYFKGIRSLHIDFEAGMTSIYGDNATGKTTVYDALTWLLFGKDSSGSAKFSIKPTDIPGVTPMVTAILEINGEPMKLRKTLREKWSKPRGCAVAQYDGDTTEYTIDDVPRKEGEYKRMIAAIIDEGVFKLLTNVHAFARDLPWKERRKQLAEVCGLPDDKAILTSVPQFAELAAALGRRTVDEYKAVLTAERKGANKTLDSLPIRIDECERRVSELDVLDYDKAQADKSALDAQKGALLADLSRLDGGSLLTAAEADCRRYEADLKTLDAENAAHRASQNVPVQDDRPALSSKINELAWTLNNLDRMAEDCEKNIEAADAQLEEYRAVWRSIQAETFTGDICPTCGQKLPAIEAAQAKAKFEQDKADREARLVKDSDLIKQNQASQKVRHAELKEKAVRVREEYEQVKAQLDAYIPPEAPAIEDLPGYKERRAKVTQYIEEAREKIGRIQSDQQAERDRLNSQLSQLNMELTRVSQVLAAKAQLDETRARVDELKAEQRAQATALEEIDRKLAICEEFSRYRCQFITDSVNSRFKLARFRLFTQQINGGVADCCDVMVDGVPYADLNNAMQINVGLDIIQTLSEHYGLRVPLFVDNAESVTKLQEIATQVVRLVVSENDKELRIV
ncbi:ATP-binding protein [Butyricicoccus pullicaecorum]|uniref:ATP-binding protein n=1 Tax=Butyricicoccus pullicaecorum TaxID=501571 RepID=UPI00194E5DDD|nr:ATP-binding protein [Butyricicoccus pullicaecorum]